MKIHKEGFKIITLFFLLLAGIDFVLIYFIPITWIWSILATASVIFFYLIVSFFRVPKRAVTIDGNKILAPSDGKVVVIEDLISTGKSSLIAVEALRNQGANVIGMLGLFTYGLKVADDNFKKSKVKLNTLSNYDILINEASNLKIIDSDLLNKLSDWRKSPNDWSI